MSWFGNAKIGVRAVFQAKKSVVEKGQSSYFTHSYAVGFWFIFELVLSVSLSLPNIFAKQFSILIFRILKKNCIWYETQCNDPKTCVHAICVTMLVQYIFITFVTVGSATNWHLLHLDL